MRGLAQWVLGSLACAALSVHADDVTVAVAANFSAPAQSIASAFSRASGHKVAVVIGSTGKFYAQIKNGAPFHILLSADDETPTRLAREGAAVGSSQFTYATGRLVLWSRQAGFVDSKGEVLQSSRFTHLAIADPKVAPYGAAAVEAMTQMRVLDKVQSRLVQGDSIGQAHQFVATGNAQLGFVALSQVYQDGKQSEGSSWVVPANLHSPLKQDAALLTAAKDSDAAKAFLVYLRGEASKAVIRSYGYEVP